MSSPVKSKAKDRPLAIGDVVKAECVGTIIAVDLRTVKVAWDKTVMWNEEAMACRAKLESEKTS